MGVDFWFTHPDDGHVYLESFTFEDIVDFNIIDKASQVKEHHWGDYARGEKYALRKRFTLKYS